MLGGDIDAKPTYQQVTQLTYITQMLKEALRLWPPAPAYGISPLKDEAIGGGKYKLRKGTFITILVTALHRDPSVWGPNPDAFNPENFSREAEAARPVNAWKPFGNGQRACIGRGFAMHEAALAIGMVLQRFKLIDVHRYQMHLKETLTIKPDGFKIKVRPRDDQDRGAFAGPVPAAAATAGAAAPRAPHAPRPQHADAGALRLQSRHGRGTWRRAWRISPRSMALPRGSAPLDEYRRQAAEGRRRADLLRLLQRRAARQRLAIRQMAARRACRRTRFKSAITPCSAAATATGPRPISRCRASSTSRWRRMARRSHLSRGEGDARSDLDGQFQNGSPAAEAGRDEGVRHRLEFQPQRRGRAALSDRADGAGRGVVDHRRLAARCR